MNLQLLYALGRPFSPFYSALMRFREFLYRKGVFRVNRMTVPVLSVGNLTMGGTGKTPVVHYLATLLQGKGMKPAIISRGYRGSARDKVNIVTDGTMPFLGVGEAGDEPRLLAETLEGVPVLTGRKRTYPARKAVEELGADVLVLDDGFQHLALARTLDLVLFNADSLAGNSRVFPGGDLREPVKALERCHAFVVTNTCTRNNDRAEQFKQLLLSHFPKKNVFFAGYEPVGLLLLNKEGWCRPQKLESIEGMPLFGFAGIARPEGFRQTLSDHGLSVVDFASLNDHHSYGDQHLADLLQKAEKAGAEACITTEKDMVKLQQYTLPLPVYVLQMRALFGSDFDEFVESFI